MMRFFCSLCNKGLNIKVQRKDSSNLEVREYICPEHGVVAAAKIKNGEKEWTGARPRESKGTRLI